VSEIAIEIEIHRTLHRPILFSFTSASWALEVSQEVAVKVSVHRSPHTIVCSPYRPAQTSSAVPTVQPTVASSVPPSDSS